MTLSKAQQLGILATIRFNDFNGAKVAAAIIDNPAIFPALLVGERQCGAYRGIDLREQMQPGMSFQDRPHFDTIYLYVADTIYDESLAGGRSFETFALEEWACDEVNVLSVSEEADLVAASYASHGYSLWRLWWD